MSESDGGLHRASGTTGSTYTFEYKPACYASKCTDCKYRDTCKNADKGTIITPVVPYIEPYTVPPHTYPWYPTIWCKSNAV